MAGDSTLFTYGAPLIGVLLVSVGIAAAVPGAYGMIQTEIADCGDPTILVETPEQTRERFDDPSQAPVSRLAFTDLDAGERAAVRDALADPQGEAHVRGEFPHYRTFLNGTVIRYEGEYHYATVVAENPCFEAAPLQFPLGVFAIALGVVGILTPPAYRKLVALEASI